MKTYDAGSTLHRRNRFRQSGWIAGAMTLSLLAMTAGAQINRSRPPTPPPSGSGSSGSRQQPSTPPPAPRSSGSDSSPRSNRGYSPPITSSGTSRSSGSGSTAADKLNGTERGGNSSLDRYNRSKEGQDSKTPHGRIGRIHYPYYPYGGYYDPYGYPYGYPYPYPDTYPVPGRSPASEARYDSPYIYCGDFTAGLYVSWRAVTTAPPKKLYVPIPIYRDGKISDWENLDAKDYMQDRNAESGDYRIGEKNTPPDAALEEAIKDIVLSWQTRDIEPLARHLRRSQKVAVILRDKYRYSLESGDYLDITQDALDSVTTARFVLDHVHRKAEGIYTLTGRHLYTDKENRDRAAYMSYVLTKMDDAYTITQIGAAPGRE